MTLQQNTDPSIGKTVAELEQRLQDVLAERDLLLEQQAASADILSAIKNSVANTELVFDKILRSIEHLFGSEERFIYLVGEDDRLHVGAAYGPNADRVRALYPVPLKGTATEKAIRERRLISYANVFDDPDVPFGVREAGRRIGHNYSMAMAPMLSEDRGIGSIFVARTSMVAFSDKECDLLQTFADQAVIAIENARLFDEVQARTEDLRESLQQQTATAEVLKVISRSPGDLAPVFDSILINANHICDASFANLVLFDGQQCRMTAMHNAPQAFEELIRGRPVYPPGTIMGRILATKLPLHVADLSTDEAFQNSNLVKLAGARSTLGVPMFKDNDVIGAVHVYRQEVRPFTQKQNELMTNFAAQAVIAMENARLLSELRARTDDLSESLQQQTATADVLKVISRSTFDLQTVLETLIKSAVDLSDANRGAIFLREGDVFPLKAASSATPEFHQYWAANPPKAGRGSATARVIQSGKIEIIPDVQADPEMEMPSGSLVRIRAALGVPLLRDDKVEGVLVLTRPEPGPFTQIQIDLVQTFADQAVIAVENVRLFDEVQARTRDLEELLQQQTATSDVLKVISRSVFDLQAVLDTLVESAYQLCDANLGLLYLKNDESFECRAIAGLGVEEASLYFKGRPIRAGRATSAERVIATGKVHSITDFFDDPEFDPQAKAIIREASSSGSSIGALRSTLAVPMMRDNLVVGVLVIASQRTGPFPARQVELLQIFADQAVIAIENARLFDELQQRTRELSSLLDDLRTAQDRLVQTEKLASLGQLTAGIAHEIKNPLNFVNNFAALSAELIDELNDALRPATLDEKTREEINELTAMLKGNLEKVVQHGKRADSIVKNMLLHSREGSGEHRSTDINALVDESLNLAYHGARAEKPNFNVTLQRNFDSGAGSIDLYPQEITRVLLNLIANGFYATAKRKEGGDEEFEPMLRASTRDLGSVVEIRVRDNGTGIPPEVQEKMFNPFFTTKPAGEGTGLGLSMSHDIVVKQHGGTLGVDTAPGQFTEFIVTLPRIGAARRQVGGKN